MGKIVYSSVWQETLHVKVVWITLLALKNWNGEVYGSEIGLAKLAGVTLEQFQEAMSLFLSPDPHSSSKEFEGRRVRVIDGGWSILNHTKYRDTKEAQDRQRNREKQARYRSRKVERLHLGPAISKTQVQSMETPVD